MIVLVVVVLAWSAGKSKPVMGQDQKVSPEKPESGGSELPGQESTTGEKTEAHTLRAVGTLDLSTLEGKGEELESREVEFRQCRVIRDRNTNGVKGISLVDTRGVGYVFWNESEDQSKFRNGVLPEGFTLHKKYQVRGKKDRPYRGNPQFQIKEFK